MRKLIIWLAVIVIIFLMGLDVVKETYLGSTQYTQYAVCYGFKMDPEVSKPVGITLIGQYKYHMIAATALIGFALFASLGKS